MSTASRYRLVRHRPVLVCLLLISMSVCLSRESAKAEGASFGRVTGFELRNGLQIVVIQDHRTPVVIHMVWYKVGSADDPPGACGLAHLLEHLTFSALDAGQGESFAQTMSRLGAIDNATTGPDSTVYFQRVARERLFDVMSVEARRMSGLSVAAEQVARERGVIREERRLVVESDPLKLLTEQVMASLYLNHGYGRPPIGWSADIEALTLQDALGAYRGFYGPANAVVVVAGDVTPSEVLGLITHTYDPVALHRLPPSRRPVAEPPPLSSRRVEMSAPGVTQPILVRYYLTPSFRTAGPLQAESLEVLATILGNGHAGRLTSTIVTGKNAVLAAGAKYFGESRDSGQFAIFLDVPARGDVRTAEAALDRALAELLSAGVSGDELARAKSAIEARAIIESDDQQALATRYGEALAAGRSIEDVAELPERIASVTAADVQAAARAFLQAPRSVTGVLMPSASTEATQ